MRHPSKEISRRGLLPNVSNVKELTQPPISMTIPKDTVTTLDDIDRLGVRSKTFVE